MICGICGKEFNVSLIEIWAYKDLKGIYCSYRCMDSVEDVTANRHKAEYLIATATAEVQKRYGVGNYFIDKGLNRNQIKKILEDYKNGLFD